jgi:hypothetical protein
MMDMVERVARAITKCQNGEDDSWHYYTDEARAAIKAMREPTDEEEPGPYKPPPETEWECGDANCGATFVTIKGYHPARCPECRGESFRACLPVSDANNQSE